MQAKKVEDKLMVCMTQFEARLLRQLLGSIDTNDNNPIIRKVVSEMSEELINNDIYFAAPAVFITELKSSLNADNILCDQIVEDGW